MNCNFCCTRAATSLSGCCGKLKYCGQTCADEHWQFHGPMCVEYCLKPDKGVETFTFGTVRVKGNYAAIVLDSLDKDELVNMAKKYVQVHNLGWNIVAPFAWKEHQIGPHVTIKNGNEGESVRVVLKCMSHFQTPTSRWVVIDAELPGKFKCDFGCHVSIGQERM